MTIFSKAGLILGFFCSTLPGFSQNDKASLEGLVLDAATRQPIASATVMGVMVNGRTVQSKFTATDGSFRLELGTKEPFRVVVRAQSYVPYEESMNFSDGRVNRRTGKIILLNKAVMPPAPVAAAASSPKKVSIAPKADPVSTPAKPPLTITDQTIELKAIQFVQSTADMVPEAQTDLDRVLTFLTQNPSVSIEVAGHTDNQGDFDQNVTLSRQRAETVKAFLVGKGIAASRITTKGYGGTRPVATNNYEKSRQLNRRVEMRIIKP
ncbi:OmpA family protein [Fibrella forsythiae]|uniref:OmpA family protein n=1 Tax=Fibrella forsythiae TaxID=2817061 RepID=A0ABS3JRL4_9BACT|nr:OmpA family protein [Fibrella forsythiae]MBO0952647.1 OmpA family protein [Fibrella forsythiae]